MCSMVRAAIGGIVLVGAAVVGGAVVLGAAVVGGPVVTDVPAVLDVAVVAGTDVSAAVSSSPPQAASVATRATVTGKARRFMATSCVGRVNSMRVSGRPATADPPPPWARRYRETRARPPGPHRGRIWVQLFATVGKNTPQIGGWEGSRPDVRGRDGRAAGRLLGGAVSWGVMHTVANPPSTLPQANDPCWCGSGRKYKRCHKRSEGRVLPGVVSPIRTVPPHINRPAYADTGEPESWDEPRIKSPDVIARMRRAGAVAAEILRLAGEAARPGITTDELDQYVHQLHIERDAYPSPLNYNGFPKSVCTSANEVICHGIPDSRVLVDGDILNIDVTAYVGGVHGDTNATFLVGDVDPISRQLVTVTEECMWHGIEAVKPGRPISDIGRAIEDHAKAHRYGVIRAFIGHGIGEQFHSDIQVLHYYDSRASMIMRPGMTFTIEPMISLGTWQHRMWDDDWTAVTADGKRTAQFEHTLVVTDDGYEVLTGGPGAVSPTAPWDR